MDKKPTQIVKPGTPAKPTEEERLRRAVAQARIEYFQGLLYNAVSSGSGMLMNKKGTPDFRPVIDAAWKGSEYVIDLLFNQAEKDQEKKEGE